MFLKIMDTLIMSKLENTEFAIKNKLKYLLNETGVFKFVLTLLKKFKKDKTICITFYSKSKAEAIIHNAGIVSIFESIHKIIVREIREFQEEGSSWITD